MSKKSPHTASTPGDASPASSKSNKSDSNLNVVFSSSDAIMCSLLAHEKTGFGLKWRPWRPRFISITNQALMYCRKEKDNKTTVLDISKIHITVIPLENVNTLNSGVAKETGLHIKCKLGGIETYFRCILPDSELEKFFAAVQKVATSHNIDADSFRKAASQSHSNQPPALVSSRSVMRSAITYEMDRFEIRSRTERIVSRRGALRWLPVLFKNDLVHGSWWFTIGSFLMVASSVVIVWNSYIRVYGLEDDDSVLPKPTFRATWLLVGISGLFYALGSLAFVRAVHDEPPMKPLFSYYHVQSDELLGSWFFFLGTLPYVPYVLLYMGQSHNKSLYLVGLAIVFALLLGTLLFVYASYPSDNHQRLQYINKVLTFCCPVNPIKATKSSKDNVSHTPKDVMNRLESSAKDNTQDVESLTANSSTKTVASRNRCQACCYYSSCCCVCGDSWRYHVSNDWLAGTWVILIASVFATLASLGFFVDSIQVGQKIAMFIYGTGFVENLMFLVGSAYFVAGSYPEHNAASLERFDTLLPSVSNKEIPSVDDLNRNRNTDNLLENEVGGDEEAAGL